MSFQKKTLSKPLLAALGVVIVFFFVFIFRQKHIEDKRLKEKARSELVGTSRDQRLKKFSLTGFDDKGKTFWNLEGDAAKIDPSQTVFLDQNVTLKLKENTVVKTDRLQWSQEAGTLKTDSQVFVNHQSVKVKGTGALGKPAESFIQLHRNIDMIINEVTRLTCQGPMKIYYREDRMVFFRKVKVVDARGTLTANRMDVTFDPDEKKVKQIIASGNVVIERDKDVTRSARAIYTLATGSIRLEGSPEITLYKENSKILNGAFRN